MRKNKAFTLIETLIAVTLTTVVLTAVTGLILSTMLANQRNLHTVQALYYAKESLEAVRFMRDSNWLQNYSWDGGAELWQADFHVNESRSEKEFYLGSYSVCSAGNPCFYFSTDETDGTVANANGFSFVRKIVLNTVPDESAPSKVRENSVQVSAVVSWEERGKSKDVTLSTYLTDWQ